MRVLRTLGVAGSLLLLSCDGSTTDLDDSLSTRLALQVVSDGSSLLAIDFARVRLSGPTPRTVTVQPGATETIGGLDPGSYSVAVEGVISAEVEWFDEFTLSITNGQTTRRTATARSFVPTGLSTDVTTTVQGRSVRVQWNAVEGAEEYEVEWADNAGFLSSETQTAGATQSDLTLDEPGDVSIRVRAINRFASKSRASSSAGPVTVHALLQPTDQCSDFTSEAVATFADGKLESAIRAALGVGPQDDLTCGLLSGLTDLNASDQGISDLAGIQNLAQLTQLFLAGNGITDVSPLAGLNSLQVLDLNDNTGLSSIQALLDNPGLGAGDSVALNGTSVACADVSALEAKGVETGSECTTGMIGGLVTGAGSAIGGAEITVNGPEGARQTVTDASGHYQLTGLAPGNYTVDLTPPDAGVYLFPRPTLTAALGEGDVAVADFPGYALDPIEAGFGTPVADGVIGVGEWAGAAEIPIAFHDPDGGVASGTLYLMNDQDQIFVGVSVPWGFAGAGSRLVLDEDADESYLHGVGEDGGEINFGTLGDYMTRDHASCPDSNPCRVPDDVEGGTIDVQGGTSSVDGMTTMELSKALDSGDAFDFTYAPGDVASFRIHFTFGVPDALTTNVLSRVRLAQSSTTNTLTITKTVQSSSGDLADNPPDPDLEGFVFDIVTDGAGTLVERATSGANGQVTVELPLGSYTVLESNNQGLSDFSGQWNVTIIQDQPSFITWINRQPSKGPKAYVVSSQSGEITVIDLEMQQVQGDAIPVLGARDIAVTQDATTAWIATGVGVTPINLQTLVAGAGISAGDNTNRVALSPDGTFAYATITSANTLRAINLVTGQVAAVVPVGTTPVDVTVSPDGSFAYVTNFDSNDVTVVDLNSLTAVNPPIAISGAAADIDLSPDGTKAYVTLGKGSDQVSVIDLGTRMEEATIDVGHTTVGIAVTPDGSTAWVTVPASPGEVYSLDLTTHQIVGAAIVLRANIEGIALTPDGQTAVVTNHFFDEVSIVDLAARQVQTIFNVAGDPSAVAITGPPLPPPPMGTLRVTKSVLGPTGGEADSPSSPDLSGFGFDVFLAGTDDLVATLVTDATGKDERLLPLGTYDIEEAEPLGLRDMVGPLPNLTVIENTTTAVSWTNWQVGWISVSAAASHTCGRTSLGQAFCWGSGTGGELGQGSQVSSSSPVRVIASPDYTFVESGYFHSCGTTVLGDTRCWGQGTFGRLGHGVLTPPHEPTPVVVQGGFDFVDVSPGGTFTCAVESGGAGYCWGRGTELGNGDPATKTTPTLVSGSHVFADVDAGSLHTCAVTSANAAYCWGNGTSGELGDGGDAAQLAPVLVGGGLDWMSVSAGSTHTCGVTTGNKAYCWGNGQGGRLGTGNESSHSSPAAVAGSHSFAAISAGGSHTCALTTDSVVMCWGVGSSGAVGVQTGKQLLPIQVEGDLLFTNVTAGTDHSCGASTDGSLYCWGWGASGQLGNGDVANRHQPTRVGPPVGE